MSEQIVIVGFGPVAARLVDELLPAVRSGQVQLTVIGQEAEAAYNRVLVADLGRRPHHRRSPGPGRCRRPDGRRR